MCLLDGDDRNAPARETTRLGMEVLRWRRYEIENYLLHPDAIARFLNLLPGAERVLREFARHIPADADPFGDAFALVLAKASTEIILPMLAALGRPTRKSDLHLIAEAMRPEEIHPEVAEKLDRLAEALNRG